MIAELVAVGTEILLGNIVNTNSAYPVSYTHLDVYKRQLNIRDDSVMRNGTLFRQYSE